MASPARTPDTIADALRLYGEKMNLRKRLERTLSLDPQSEDAGDVAINIASGFIPGISQGMALRDMERARRANDQTGVALAATGLIPGGKFTKVLSINNAEKAVKVKIPIEQIEHGESVMPGGKLTWPGSARVVRDYASRKTPLPPIEVVSTEQGATIPWMVVDGSHRLEAAKLRGQKTIDALVSPHDLEGLAMLKTMGVD